MTKADDTIKAERKAKALDGGTTERMNPLMIGSNDLKKEE